MNWKDANKYKPKKHPKNRLFSVDVVLSFGKDVLSEPNVIGYYNFYENMWQHEEQYFIHPIAFLEYPEFEGLK